MFQIPFRWLQDLLADLLGPDSDLQDPADIPPLSNEEYKALWLDLLDCVARGWQQTRIFEKLGIRRYDPWFSSWLQRYGRSLMRQDPHAIDRDVAGQMVRLGKIGCGDLGEVSQQIGTRLFELSDRDILTPQPETTLPPTISSQDPVELFNYGAEQYRQGQLEGAVSLWETALEVQPDLFDARNGCGTALYYLGRYEAAIAHFNRALEIASDSHLAAFNRGSVYLELKQYDAAIADFSRAIEIKPDFALGLNGRGMAYTDSGQDSLALDDFNNAIALQPNLQFAYNGRGIIQGKAGELEAALADFQEALSLNPNYYDVYHNCGNILRELGRYSEAIEKFTQGILIQPNFYQAYYSRGNTHAATGNYQEAIADYREAITIQPAYILAYNGWGLAATQLGHYDEAIAQFDRAIAISPAFWQIWANRGWTIFQASSPTDCDAAIHNWNEGLSKLKPDSSDYYLARGTLQYYKGLAAAKTAIGQENSRSYWEKAIASYQKSLDALQDRPNLEEPYLEVMQGLILANHALGNSLNVKNYINIALIILNQLVLNLKNPREKLRLSQKFIGFHHLKIERLARSSDRKQQILALQLAEERKNLSIYWQQNNAINQTPIASPNYQQLQQLLDANTGGIYWHISPVSITTFILRDRQPLLVIPADSSQLAAFENWLKDGDRREANDPISTLNPQKFPATHLQSLQELSEILQVDKILSYFSKTVDRLVLIPHQILHLLPLHLLFSTSFKQRDFNITYLPSGKFGLRLTNSLPLSPQTQSSIPLLTIDPASNPISSKALEVNAIAQFFPSKTMGGIGVSKETVLEALETPTHIFHFAGNSYQDTLEPQNSALTFANEEQLTLRDIFSLDHPSASLVCLSACETRSPTLQEAGNEFVGFAVGFLVKGATYVVYSLWQVTEISTSLLMIRFYELLKQEIKPAEALKKAQMWLRDLSYDELIKTCDRLLKELEDAPSGCLENLKMTRDLARDKAARQGESYWPYSQPYYWGGFVLSGKVD
ncbi:tetratricopeptide repeat protein [Spirulina sp. 06S082]|uniref:tetratricopeptide repeat protein n=1 Tax=Spirulina sp. 06S082 TaxID=3110248 RepID=UPI002B1FF912|nr:tetratricopeptide repeat protein [Spirulina sp. 06S082]MEA5470392.1 tetratricopeptide repeat protein [Spirulina sp. 06S082]